MRSHDLAAHVHHTAEELHNKAGERRTRWVVLLAGMMMIGELTFGWWTGSVALPADGLHTGTDVGARDRRVVGRQIRGHLVLRSDDGSRRRRRDLVVVGQSVPAGEPAAARHRHVAERRGGAAQTPRSDR